MPQTMFSSEWRLQWTPWAAFCGGHCAWPGLQPFSLSPIATESLQLGRAMCPPKTLHSLASLTDNNVL